MVGPSGCGKSTLLHLIAGFDKPTTGQLRLGGTTIRGPGPDRGMLFQDLALFPWRSVLGNVTWGLEGKGIPRAKREATANRYIEMVGLSGFQNAYPNELSGGMKQRVAVARVLAFEPRILLMDEPFAALDAQTRELMQDELTRIWQSTDGARKTVLFVTHDIDEAIFLADRVLLMTARAWADQTYAVHRSAKTAVGRCQAFPRIHRIPQYDLGPTPRGSTSLKIGGTMKRLDARAAAGRSWSGVRNFTRLTKKHHVRWTSILSWIALLSFWEYEARSGVLPTYVVAPSVIGITLMQLAADGELWKNLSVSLWRASIGLTIGASFGTLVGLFATVNRPVELYFNSLVSLTYPVPKIRSSLS